MRRRFFDWFSPRRWQRSHAQTFCSNLLDSIETSSHDGILIGSADPKLSEQGRDELVTFVISALEIIRDVDPTRYSRLKRHVHAIVDVELNSALGGYLPSAQLVVIDIEKLYIPAKVELSRRLCARVLVHEATHGHINESGMLYTSKTRKEIERLCTEEENLFVKRLGYPWTDLLSVEFRSVNWLPLWHPVLGTLFLLSLALSLNLPMLRTERQRRKTRASTYHKKSRPERCFRCGADEFNLNGDAGVLSGGFYPSLGSPLSRFTSCHATASLVSRTCRQCGVTELYAASEERVLFEDEPITSGPYRSKFDPRGGSLDSPSQSKSSQNEYSAEPTSDLESDGIKKPSEFSFATTDAPRFDLERTFATVENAQVVLEDVGDDPVAVMEKLNELMSITWSDPVVLAEAAPCAVMEEASYVQAEQICNDLEKVGAVVSIRLFPQTRVPAPSFSKSSLSYP